MVEVQVIFLLELVQMVFLFLVESFENRPQHRILCALIAIR